MLNMISPRKTGILLISSWHDADKTIKDRSFIQQCGDPTLKMTLDFMDLNEMSDFTMNDKYNWIFNECRFQLVEAAVMQKW